MGITFPPLHVDQGPYDSAANAVLLSQKKDKTKSPLFFEKLTHLIFVCFLSSYLYVY
ncbi:hypothetical protein VIBC2010_09932 [Vibrio caribbeanicus ATCC BAA-2122]|uniref:Uncharacterized protein n=1 Tax=Vibrio caribbeanicus ATCC BAA-2122 TaxID=796620 RepID=E3BK07_9VIBR|nr:hypothetical protein VIBC2010_09932 [Vibrio caribbeanicus ATCC BAA-2122]